MLVEAAGSVGRMHGKNYLAAQHARLTKRRGMGRAQVAVAHSILVSAYYMLKRDEPYHDLGAGLARPPQRRSPHPPAGRPARDARPHRRPRPRRLTSHDQLHRRAPPDGADARPGSGIHGSVSCGEAVEFKAWPMLTGKLRGIANGG